MTSSSADILIVGAGPTGLMLACQLSLYSNISIRIIDKSSSRNTQSRALVVHARSLELFAQLNLVDKAIARGEFVNTMKGFFQGQCRVRIDLARIAKEHRDLLTHYPHILALQQSVTEELLESFLNEHGIKVQRDSEVVDLLDLDPTDDDRVKVTLNNGDIIQAKYICACDGARSIVRHKLNLSFSGRTYSESLFIADCEVKNSPIGENDMAVFLASSGMAGIFPMVNNQYRLMGTIHEEENQDIHLSVDDVVTKLKDRTRHFDMDINKCHWISKYRSHHRHITSFRYRKQYFLLGDAAHIHSPVGGQGMNTGLQDAHNLAWKLAYTLTHKAKDYLLDTYHNERSAVASTLVNTTDRVFTFISSPYWFTSFCRLYIAPVLLRFFIQPLFNHSKTVRQGFFRRISQLGITYRSENIYDYGASAGNFRRNTPFPGDLFPCSIFDPCYYHLIIFENQQSAKVNLFVEMSKKKYPEIIKIHDAHEENLPFQFEGAMLIRPDGYIAYRTTAFNIAHFQSYFAQFF